MAPAVEPTSAPLEWAVLARPRSGEQVSGDIGLVKVIAGGAMVAAIDGLGHGQEAAGAAVAAAAVVTQTDDRDVVSVMQQCDQALRATRGAAISLAWLSVPRDTITWIGLGNVEGRLISARGRGARDRSLRLLAGVAGHEVPRLASATIKVRRGDVVVFASDGVDGTFADALELSGAATEIAERILASHWDGTDDALVIVLRWLPSMGQDGR